MVRIGALTVCERAARRRSLDGSGPREHDGKFRPLTNLDATKGAPMNLTALTLRHSRPGRVLALLLSLVFLLAGCGGGGLAGGNGYGVTATPTPVPPTGSITVELTFAAGKTASASVNPITAWVQTVALPPNSLEPPTQSISLPRLPSEPNMSITLPNLPNGTYDTIVQCTDVNGNSTGAAVLRNIPVNGNNVTVPATNTLQLVSLAVTPTRTGVAIGATRQFTATATYSDGTTAPVTYMATWTAADSMVNVQPPSNFASIGASTGLASGLSQGLSIITATLAGVSNRADLSVVPPPQIYATGNNSVTRMDDMAGTGRISFGTAGSGVGQFNNPTNLTMDADGLLLLCDAGNNRIVRMDDMTGAGFTSFGTNGNGVGQFNEPWGISLGLAGDIYVADSSNNRIVRMDDMSGANFTAYGTAGSGTGQFNRPMAVAVGPAGEIYVADRLNNRIVRMDDMSGKNFTAYGTSGRGVGNFNYPAGVAVGPDGAIYVADTLNSRVVRMDDISGKGFTSFGTLGTGFGQFNTPWAINVGTDGCIYVGDAANQRIVRMDDISGKNLTSYSPGFPVLGVLAR